MSEDEQALAVRVAEAMYSRDRAARMLGVEILEVRPGFARLAFTVRDEMLNSHGVCHGGFLFTLADTAFAYACNARNASTVALQCSITFSAPGNPGECLTAIASERAGGGRTGTYDVEVRRDDHTIVALFRGTSYRITGSIV
jgi:acyl-CoA thioesterase